MAEEDLEGLQDVERDSHGHLRLAEVDFGNILKAKVQERLQQLKIKTTIASKNIGYELRCADPIPMDMEYTRDLGYCAAKYMLAGGSGAMVSMQGGHFIPIPFAELTDPATGKSKVRLVDTSSTRYAIARRYMIRLRRDDFDNPDKLARLARSANLSPEDIPARVRVGGGQRAAAAGDRRSRRNRRARLTAATPNFQSNSQGESLEPRGRILPNRLDRRTFTSLFDRLLGNASARAAAISGQALARCAVARQHYAREGEIGS